MVRALKQVLFYCCVTLGGWFFLHCAWITADGLTDDTQAADCLVVLGNTVYPDGTLSKRLQARLDKALQLYRTGNSRVLFVSGGLGHEGQYEGTAMQQYLVVQGVPKAAIIVDNAGNNTLATARNFAQVARQRHFSSAIVVSQFFHLTRTKLMLRQQSIPAVYAAHPSYYEWRDGYALLREFFAYYAYRLA